MNSILQMVDRFWFADFRSAIAVRLTWICVLCIIHGRDQHRENLPRVCLAVPHSCLPVIVWITLRFPTFQSTLRFTCFDACGWWATLPFVWNLRLKWLTPVDKRRLRQISAYSVSTVRDSEKVQLWRIESNDELWRIMTNRHTHGAFQRAIDEVRMLP